ncbi:hypothetical protein H0N95_02340 [Candidatus Micrarchaeota archaeon]|nr:hypothetical protein [Candidatus Micrarchaeota archaeon]
MPRKNIRKIRKGPSIPVYQPLLEERIAARKNAEYEISYYDTERKPTYLYKGPRHSPEKFLNDSNVKSVKFLGTPREITREEVMQMPRDDHFRKLFLKKEELRAKAELDDMERHKAAQSAVKSAEVASSISPAEKIGVDPTKRYNVKVILTPAGKAKGMLEADYDIPGPKIVEWAEQGLISDLRVTESNFNMSTHSAAGLRRITPEDRKYQEGTDRRGKRKRR